METFDIEAVVGHEMTVLLATIGNLAQVYEASAYLVGGFVRDMLLGHVAPDIDIMLDKDVSKFVNALQSNWTNLFPPLAVPRPPVVFHKYLTAKLSFEKEVLPGVDLIDFATAREENYPSPGSQPIVSIGTLKSDMLRRDFSANALALDLSTNNFCTLHDFVGGREAITARELRVIHSRSFLEDPARMLRGLRLIARLNFRFSDETEILYREALENNYLHTIPRFRLFDEFRKALMEQEINQVFETLSRFDILKQIHPKIIFREISLPDIVLKENRWKLALLSLFAHCNTHELREILISFGLSPKSATSILSLRA